MTKLHKLKTPIFWAEGHPGALNPATWQLQITGACEQAGTFSLSELQKLPPTTVSGRLTSVTRWSVFGQWTGLPLSQLLELVKMKDSCRYIRFWSVDEIYDTSIPLDIALKEKSLITWAFDGEPLHEDYGGPLRAFIPYLWGYKSAKSIVKIELMEYYVPGFWELRGYTDSAEILPGACRDINDGGKIKEIAGGDEVVDFL